MHSSKVVGTTRPAILYVHSSVNTRNLKWYVAISSDIATSCMHDKKFPHTSYVRINYIVFINACDAITI